MQVIAETPVAPSATPEAAPATQAATASPAPSAGKPLTSLKEIVDRAIAMRQEAPPQAQAVEPQAAPAAPADESPAEAAVTPPTEAAPVAADEIPADPPTDAPEEAELAEVEKVKDPEKLLSALRKDRAKVKEIKQQLKEAKAGTPEVAALQARLAELEAKMKPAAPENKEQPPQAGVPATPEVLAGCETMEAVDTCVMQAATAETLATTLRLALARNDVSAVVKRLAAEGVTEVAGVPVAEASEQQLDAFLDTVYANARQTVAAAGVRKRQLVQEGASATKAIQLIPELAEKDSKEARQFWSIVEQNPWLRRTSPNWPEVVAKQLLGERAATALNQPKPTAKPTPPPVPPTAKRTPPGAPKVTAAGMPPTGEIETLRAKQQAGKATVADMVRLQTLQTFAKAA